MMLMMICQNFPCARESKQSLSMMTDSLTHMQDECRKMVNINGRTSRIGLMAYNERVVQIIISKLPHLL